MQKTASNAKSSKSYQRPTLQRSTTLSRKYVKKPSRTSTTKIAINATDDVADAISTPKITSAALSHAETMKRRQALAKEMNEKRLAELRKKRIATEKAAEKAKAEPAKVLSEKKKAEAKSSAKEVMSSSSNFKTKATAAELSRAIVASSAKASALAAAEKAEKAKKAALAAKKAAAEKAAKEAAEKKAKEAEEARLKAEAEKKEEEKALAAKKAAAEKKAAEEKAVEEKKAEMAAEKAMHSIATMGETTKPLKKKKGRRIALALGCSALVVGALAVFVHMNMPNISVKVAAMQTGIEATYPSSTPRNYSLETVSSDKDGKIVMTFTGPNNASFTLTEEKSTWDSTAVLNNYVKTNYSSNYSTLHEQGITYYSESGAAVWVNGGVLYTITSDGKNLTKEQIRNLVVSL